MMTEAELIANANALVGEFRTSADCSAGGVAAAIMSASGRVYTGICVDTQCSMGFCAEHAAVAEMLKARESEIVLLVAVASGGKVVAPCGRCRELMWQVSPRNRHAMVVIRPGHQVMLAELLPHGGSAQAACLSRRSSATTPKSFQPKRPTSRYGETLR